MPFVNPTRNRLCERMARLYPGCQPCEIEDAQLLEMYAKINRVNELRASFHGWIPDETLANQFPKLFGFEMPEDHRIYWALHKESEKYTFLEFLTYITPTLIADPEGVYELLKQMPVVDAIDEILSLQF